MLAGMGTVVLVLGFLALLIAFIGRLFGRFESPGTETGEAGRGAPASRSPTDTAAAAAAAAAVAHHRSSTRRSDA